MTYRPYPNVTLPVPSGPVIDHDASLGASLGASPGRHHKDAGYTVQLIGEGEKRGLRGGRNMLDAAKTTYMRAEFSGTFDRRPRPGRLTRQKI